MFLKGSVKLKPGSSKFLKRGLPWVYSNELSEQNTNIPAGSWVALESPHGEVLGYGHYNPHSLIAFRLFERSKFRSEELTRALFFKRMDWALRTRLRAYAEDISQGELGRFSFRLCFGESDGLAGLVVDLFETVDGKAFPVIQCHSAGADQFIFWLQQWFDERMGVHAGLIKNDLDVRDREKAKREVVAWGSTPELISSIEGGVRFLMPTRAGQKTGFFYDLRDVRRIFSKQVGALKQNETIQVLDCFSYVGAWGLQCLKKNPNAKLLAVDSSQPSLELLKEIASHNKLSDRVNTECVDLFKDREFYTRKSSQKAFHAIICDPPSISSSSKQKKLAIQMHEKCFHSSLGMLHDEGIAAFAACSYHFTNEDFQEAISKAALSWNKPLKVSYLGSQSYDHPVLTTLAESRYIKCMIAEWLLAY